MWVHLCDVLEKTTFSQQETGPWLPGDRGAVGRGRKGSGCKGGWGAWGLRKELFRTLVVGQVKPPCLCQNAQNHTVKRVTCTTQK